MRSRPEPGAYAEPMQPLVAPVAALDPEELVRTARHAVLSGTPDRAAMAAGDKAALKSALDEVQGAPV